MSSMQRPVAVSNYVCCGSNRRPMATEVVNGYELVFVRRGTFTLWTHKREIAVTPNEVLFLPPGATYAASHPVAGGDECTILTCSPELLGPAFRKAAQIRVASATAALFRMQAVAFRRVTDELQLDETLLQLVELSQEHFEPRAERNVARATPQQRRLVRRAQELITARYAERLPLPLIAHEAGASPFHLSRLFRRLNGKSMHRFQTELRLRLALQRILDGEDDLGSLALELGFSSHSHFTASFRRVFGVAPTSFRPASKTWTRILSRIRHA